LEDDERAGVVEGVVEGLDPVVGFFLGEVEGLRRLAVGG
jgi:hypothetical protein